MKALVYNGPEDIRYQDYQDPELRDARDMLVRITRCGICGSDLHIYHGNNPAPPEITRSNSPGYCVGHEAVGEVVEVGREVRNFRSGDQVVLSGAVGCGDCLPCRLGQMTQCERVVRTYGLGHSLQGCQAEAVTVPVADFNAMRIPDGLSPNQALMLTDNLPTAFFGCRNADVRPGRTVVVVGLGPIGLMAVECAQAIGRESRVRDRSDRGAPARSPHRSVQRPWIRRARSRRCGKPLGGRWQTAPSRRSVSTRRCASRWISSASRAPCRSSA